MNASQQALFPEEEVCEMVNRWNTTLNNRDETGSRAIYADVVDSYGTKLSAAEAAARRVTLAMKDPSWNQKIVSDVYIDFSDAEHATAEFTKQSTSKKGVHTYPAYLCMERINGKWRVTRESDKLTDANVAGRKKAAKAPKGSISGDFDGDGTADCLWTEATKDHEGYTTSPVSLMSDNRALASMQWKAGMRGVQLFNVGDLKGDGHDYLLAVPYSDSNWTMCQLLVFTAGGWKKAVDDFQVYLDGDFDLVRATGNPGSVIIRSNDSDDEDLMFEKQPRVVNLRY